ncbi:hypothetical protein FRZ67_16960 [Panacibacter ginsenosidivorans]|uniref:Uncharacterized protein n=1 Tax=Panacibacter ginsenosidivorans TaxID=1813871 RepID=A0A5B8VE27_9BACT|nr:hypothetical protein [Panacibacter ginsenosidivorans]QEC68916.1 hypothetical protein FRZ67_16960 [Panacibacter ginsenosidivorans]
MVQHTSYTVIFWTAILGAIAAGIVIPFVKYAIPRYFNKLLIKVTLEQRKENTYSVYNLRLFNKTFSTLKNVYAYVTIDNDASDIVKQENFRISFFCSDSAVDFGMLSWSKNVNNQIAPNIDINQGEAPDINFVRYHVNNPDDAIEVSSEQGFFDEKLKNSSRIVLKAGNRDFIFNVLITADNICPKKLSFRFNHNSRNITAF